MLARENDELDHYINTFKERIESVGARSHPFAFHLALLFRDVYSRNAHVGTFLRTLLLLEDQLIFDDTRVTFQDPDETKKQLQQLHSLYQDFIINQNYNNRDVATIKCLLRDLERLDKLQDTKNTFPIDQYLHQRVIDGFLCLQDFCEDRAVRLASRTQRVQNLIGLVRTVLLVCHTFNEADMIDRRTTF